MKFCKNFSVFPIYWINNKQSRLNIKHSQTVYDRNVQAMTEAAPSITNLHYIQVYKYILRHSETEKKYD